MLDTTTTPPLSTITGSICSTARQFPDSLAIATSEQCLSYQELTAWMYRGSASLRDAGVLPGDLVAIHLPRDIRLVPAILAILHAGAAYLPIDMTLPPGRQRAILDAATPRLILTDEPFDHDATCCWDDCPTAPSTPTTPSSHPDDLAYVLFTSGSTGTPKGVQVTHANVLSLLNNMVAFAPPADCRRVLFGTSCSFDLSVWEMFAPLTCGGTVVQTSSPVALADVPAELYPTIISTVPSALRVLLAHDLIIPTVRRVFSSGEALTGDLARALTSLPSAPTIVNLYGPTEATVWQVGAVITATTASAPPIGTPLPGMDAWLCTPDGSPTDDATGELVVVGPQVTPGYLTPHVDQQRFASVDGHPTYRTGDLVRRDHDGTLHYLGRTDDQVQINGYRVEVSDLTRTATDVFGVETAIVLDQPDGTPPGTAASYVCHAAIPDAPPWGSEAWHRAAARRLRDVSKHLPPHLAPRRVALHKNLPHTLSGKVDKVKLSECPLPEAVLGVDAPPALRRTIAGAMSTSLGTAVDDAGTFRHAGADSFHATSVAAFVHQCYDLTLTPPQVLDSTAGDIATLVQEERTLATIRNKPVEAGEIRSSTMPASVPDIAAAVWVGDTLSSPHAATWNIASSFLLHGHVDVGALHQAMAHVVRDVDCLRTTLPSPTGYVTHEDLPWLWAVHHVDDASPTDRQQVLRDAASAPLDLHDGPVCGMTILVDAPDRATVVFAVHHGVCDGVSLPMIMSQLATRYDGIISSQAPTAHIAVPGAFAPAAEILANRRASTGSDCLAHWRTRLHGFAADQAPPLPGTRSPDAAWVGAREEIRLDEDVVRHVERCTTQHGTSLFVAVMCSAARAMHQRDGRPAAVIAAPVNQRLTLSEVRTPGLLLAMGLFPVTHLADAWVTCLRENHQAISDDLAAGVPSRAEYAELSAVDSDPRTERSALMTVSVLPSAKPVLLPSGTWSMGPQVETGGARADLTLYWEPTHDGVVLALEYAADVCGATTAEEYLYDIRSHLSSIPNCGRL